MYASLNSKAAPLRFSGCIFVVLSRGLIACQGGGGQTRGEERRELTDLINAKCVLGTAKPQGNNSTGSQMPIRDRVCRRR